MGGILKAPIRPADCFSYPSRCTVTEYVPGATLGNENFPLSSVIWASELPEASAGLSTT
jgi:hypothetical protein